MVEQENKYFYRCNTKAINEKLFLYNITSVAEIYLKVEWEENTIVAATLEAFKRL